jgi:hypothetical protein
VLQLQRPPAQGLPDPPGELLVLPRPGGIGIGDLDANRRGGAGQPRIGSGGGRESSNDTISARLGIGAVYLPAHRL